MLSYLNGNSNKYRKSNDMEIFNDIPLFSIPARYMNKLSHAFAVSISHSDTVHTPYFKLVARHYGYIKK